MLLALGKMKEIYPLTKSVLFYSVFPRFSKLSKVLVRELSCKTAVENPSIER